MSRYLKKEGASYRFKTEMLSRFGPSDLNDEIRDNLWTLFLDILAKEGKISKNASKTWKYPTKYLK